MFKIVSDALLALIRDEVISRDELIICSKGGFIPDPDRISWFYSRSPAPKYVLNPINRIFLGNS